MEGLSDEDLQILIDECESELGKLRKRLGENMIERDLLRRRIKKWEKEKETLLFYITGELDKLYETSSDYNSTGEIFKTYDRLKNKYNKSFRQEGDKELKSISYLK